MCGGAYIKLAQGLVTIGSTSDIQCHGPLRIGPSAGQHQALPQLPTQKQTGLQLWHAYPNGEPVKNASYVVQFPDGTTRYGTLDANGRGTLANVPRGGGTVHYFEEPGDLESRARKWREPQFNANALPMPAGANNGLPSLTGPIMATAASQAQSVAGPALTKSALGTATGKAAKVVATLDKAMADASTDTAPTAGLPAQAKSLT